MLTKARWQALIMAGARETITIQDVAEEMSISDQAASKHIHALAEALLVRKATGGRVKKPHKWEITARGRHLVNAVGDPAAHR